MDNFKLKYLVMPDWIYEDNRLSFLEGKILSFIYAYKGKKFYFSNEQLGEMFKAHGNTAGKAINQLKQYGYIDTEYKIKAGGGKLRFITKNHIESDSTTSLSGTQLNDPVLYIKDNKVNDNKRIKEKDTPLNPPRGTLSLTTYLEEFNSLFAKRYRKTPALEKKLKLRLKTYTLEEILKALRNMARSEFHHGKNDRGWEAKPEFLIRTDEKIDEWLNTAAQKQHTPGFEISEGMGFRPARGGG